MKYMDNIIREKHKSALSASHERALRIALKEAVSNAKIQIDGGLPDPEISHLLRSMCERYGYGNMMATISSLWRQKDPIGAFAFGPCMGSIDRFMEMSKKAGVE